VEKNVCLLAVDGHIASGVVCNRIWRSGDVLVVAVFLSGLGRVGLDAGFLAQVGIGDRELFVVLALGPLQQAVR
jgi:hypothetical protein